MNIKWPFFGKKTAPKASDQARHASHKKGVLKATQVTLDRYSKTFKDLARYDRGEKISNSISR